jgi:Flp pilus assembly protein TadG
LIALRHILVRARNVLRRFGAAREGAAAVEFAIILPVLITLYMGTIEVSDLIAVDRRVSVIAGSMGDLVARADGSITTATLTDYFKAAEGIIVPYAKTGLKQVVTCVAVNNTGVTTVSWSQGYNGGVAKVVGQPFVLPTEMSAISHNNWVIVSETYYAYKPLLGMIITQPINLHRQSYYLPRYGQYIALN